MLSRMRSLFNILELNSVSSGSETEELMTGTVGRDTVKVETMIVHGLSLTTQTPFY